MLIVWSAVCAEWPDLSTAAQPIDCVGLDADCTPGQVQELCLVIPARQVLGFNMGILHTGGERLLDLPK